MLQVMLALAGLYLSTEDLDACQHQLMTLLKGEKDNDAATIVRYVFFFTIQQELQGVCNIIDSVEFVIKEFF